jgi:low temperature requirement protein LtrA
VLPDRKLRFIVAGIIVSAVADEFVLAHPLGHTGKKTAIAVLGSTAIFLVGNMLFKWTSAGRVALSHLAGIATLALLMPVSVHLPPLMLAMLATVVLVVIAAWERNDTASLNLHSTRNDKFGGRLR